MSLKVTDYGPTTDDDNGSVVVTRKELRQFKQLAKRYVRSTDKVTKQSLLLEIDNWMKRPDISFEEKRSGVVYLINAIAQCLKNLGSVVDSDLTEQILEFLENLSKN